MEGVLRLEPAPAWRTDLPDGGSIVFIGNATVLLRYRGFTILTDPTFVHRHEKVPLGYGMSAKRLTDPAVELQDLPPLDLVLLSHFHGDHFDQIAQRDLDKSLPRRFRQGGHRRSRAPVEAWRLLRVELIDVRRRGGPGEPGPPLHCLHRTPASEETGAPACYLTTRIVNLSVTGLVSLLPRYFTRTTLSPRAENAGSRSLTLPSSSRPCAST
jgi:hypothetical protein